jgi:hypothetical protein
MAEGRLYEADRRATVEGMARMRMAQPGGEISADRSCSVGGGVHAVEDLCGQE